MNAKFFRTSKFGTVPSNWLKLRSLQEYNNTDVIITKKKVYNCTTEYEKKKHVRLDTKIPLLKCM